jgi:hypothetical protein
MPITINGSGTIGGLNAGGLPDGVITAPDLDGAQTGSAPIYGCRAWVNFDGTRNAADTGASTNGANVKIRASGNVTSVLKNAVGDYTVNFTTAMPDANYSLVATSSGQSSVRSWHTPSLDTATTPTASLARVSVLNTTSAKEDDPYVFVTIFR